LKSDAVEWALSEEPRAGAERKLTGKEEALLAATACASPPEGRARWTLELLAGARPGQLERYDYEYRRNGTVNLFVLLDVHRPRRASRCRGQHRAFPAPDAWDDPANRLLAAISIAFGIAVVGATQLDYET
jgi:hypothetical protein